MLTVAGVVAGDALLAGRHVPEEPDPAARQLQPLLPPAQATVPLHHGTTQVALSPSLQCPSDSLFAVCN